MKCSQMHELIDRYLDGIQEGYDMESFRQHIRQCKSCRIMLDEKRELMYLFKSDAGPEVPLNFTNKVMESVKDLKAPARVKAQKGCAISYPVFRRLGVSMLLTAVLMIFSIFIPPEFGGAINGMAVERTSEIVTRTSELSKDISKINNSIKAFYKNFENTLSSIRR